MLPLVDSYVSNDLHEDAFPLLQILVQRSDKRDTDEQHRLASMLGETATKLGVHPWTVKRRHAKGTLGLDTRKLNDMGQYMYENPEARDVEQPGHSSACAQEA